VRQVKHNNRLYVRIYGQGAGAMVAGEALTSLPNSVLAVVEGDRASGGTTAVSSALIGAWDIPVDVAVTGMRTLTLTPVAARLP
jgi:NADH:ubiquinone oxidoreductase subunit F (NADH-binding)